MSGQVLPSALPVGLAPARLTSLRSRTRHLLAQPGLVLSLMVFVVVAAWALLPSVFAHYHPVTDLDQDALLAPPSAAHWFGTDLLGRDVFSRVVHGTRLSLLAGLIAVALSLVVGSLLGMVSAYVGGWFDSLVMRVVDVLVAIPGLLLSMAAVSILGFGVVNVAIAVGIAGIPAFARLTRAETLRILSRGYFDAARSSGTGHLGILSRHVTPNASGAVLVLAALELGGAVLSVAALSFLGFGAVPPTPEWGSMINEGRAHIVGAWWLTTFPGVAIAATVLASNRISRSLRVRQR